MGRITFKSPSRFGTNLAGTPLVDSPVMLPPVSMARQVAMASIVAAWSLVVAVPLFAAVGIQTQIDAPPPRADRQQQLVTLWEPTTWDSQRAKFAPDRSVVTPPYTRLWLYDRWPQPEWDSQATRKAPIPNAIVIASPPFSRSAYQALPRWDAVSVDPLWSQVGLQTQVDLAPLQTKRQPMVVATWEPLTWDSQRTRNAPIPTAATAPPFSRSWLYDRWPQPEWESPRARGSASLAPRIDNPPFGQRLWLMGVVLQWEPGPPMPILRRTVSTPDTPVVVASVVIWKPTWVPRRRS